MRHAASAGEARRQRLRILLSRCGIPILIVLGTVSGGTWQYSTWQYDQGANLRVTGAVAGGLLFLGPLLMLVFRQKYPRWWFDWNLELFFLGIAAFVAVVIAWFAILFTGRYPRGLFDFVAGTIRWDNRVVGYALILTTDQYPPFRLSP
jgi:hypothetical protein